MSDNRFCNIVAGLEVDDAARAQELAANAPSVRNYIVFFTPRSGSSWLTTILAATNVLGRPAEFLNPAFLRDIARSTNARDQRDLLAVLRRRRKSATGVFGIETMASHVKLFGEDIFFSEIGPRPVVFCLWRDNLIAQGVSLYRAMATRRFHSSSAAVPPPDYDAAQIRNRVIHVAANENANMEMIASHRLPARMLRYEDIVRSREATIVTFADAMRVEVSPKHMAVPDASELTKIGDGWNRETERRFRAEHALFVTEMEAQRAIKTEP